ncbi:hypothetical protein GCM10023094_50760 [Rhodococcus olei]|uniref:Uncharacterized protein n=1 Tax=Rhodococcus olei TaxID=2161675 RepID=A0ABP8PLK2_9NOCA
MAPEIPGSEPASGTPSPAGGTALLRVALALFFVGLLAIVAIFVVHATDHTPGLALYLVAMACPIGFLLGIVSALRAGRRVRGEE